MNIKAKSIIAILIASSLIFLTGCSSSKDKVEKEEDVQTAQGREEKETTTKDKKDKDKDEDKNSTSTIKDSDENNNSWNINNGGLVARQGDWYYYADETFGLLYKVRLDGRERTKLDGEFNVESINVVDNWIYYTANVYKTIKGASTRVSNKLFKISLDGTKKVNSNKSADYVRVEGDYIYFSNLNDEGKLYKMDLDFKKPVKIDSEKNIRDIFFVKDWIYYLADGGIYKVKNDGTLKTCEIPSTDIRKFGITESNIYYWMKSAGDLYKASLDNTIEREVIANSVKSVIVKDKYIFYTRGITNSLYRVELDSNNPQKFIEIGSGSAIPFSIIGDTIFYVGRQNNKDGKGGFHSKQKLNDKRSQVERKGDLMSLDNKEVKLGISYEKLMDYVIPLKDKIDKNTIMENISRDVSSFFDGNCMVTDKAMFDTDRNNSNEVILIYKQSVTDSKTAQRAVKMLTNNIQIVFTVLKWDGEQLIICGANPLTVTEKFVVERDNRPRILMQNAIPGGNNELIVVVDKGHVKQYDIYKVFERSLEWVNPKSLPNFKVN